MKTSDFKKVFFCFILFLLLLTSCSTKREALNFSLQESISEQINSILNSEKEKFNSKINISYLDGKITINEIEYDTNTNIDSFTRKPVVKKEKSTIIDFLKNDSILIEKKITESSKDSTSVNKNTDLNQNIEKNKTIDSSTFLSYIYKIGIVLIILLIIILINRLISRFLK